MAGGKGSAINDFFYCHLEIKIILLYTTYRNMDGHIKLKFASRYFYWVVTIFSKNRDILVEKMGE